MNTIAVDRTPERPGPLDRFLRVFGDVRSGEGGRVLLMSLSIFALLIAYYIIKTVREPLILLGGGAEVKSYAGAAQALTLVFYVPLYGWVASRLPRFKLIVAVVLFFFCCIQVFFLWGQSGLPYVGVAFFIWVGIFSLTTIAQFWSYANDIYSRPDGERLFPLIAVGSTAGAFLGAVAAERLFALGFSPFVLMQIAAGLLLLHLGLYVLVARQATPGATGATPTVEPLKKGDGFALVLRNRYLLLFALMLILLNIVNAVGEYMLDVYVQRAAQDVVAQAMAAQPSLDVAGQHAVAESFIGQFKGAYFLGFNLLAVVLQAFFVSRLVRWTGVAGAVFALPLVALGSYGIAAFGAGLAIVRWAKTAENATDYSVMNTGKQMLWLPTTREEKYKAKQAIDTFFVRMGDMIAGGVVYAGTHWLALGPTGFARLNLVVVAAWIAVTVALLRRNRQLTPEAKA
jgi:ATP:ADP antiporter, AAA family